MPIFPNGSGPEWDVLNATGLRKNNFGGSRAPGASDDVSVGYERGSRWWDGSQWWTCRGNSAGAAEWVVDDATAASQKAEDALATASPQPSYDAALAYNKPETQHLISAMVGERLIKWVRAAAAGALGGGWGPEGYARPEHFNNDFTALRNYAGADRIVVGGPSVAGSVYGNDVLGTLDDNCCSIGAISTPNLSHEPLYRMERVSGAVYDPNKLSEYTPMAEWTQRITGGGAHHVVGTFYGYTNGYAREIIGAHGRAEAQPGATVDGMFGLWGIAIARSGSTVGSIAGAELNVANQMQDFGWQASLHGSNTRSVGLILNYDGATAASFAASAAFWVARNTGGSGRGEAGSWHTGLLFDRNAITRADASGNNEAIRIRGGEGATYQHGGIRFGDAGTDMPSRAMTYGIRSTDMDFSDDALIWAKPGHRIRWGADKATARYIGISPDSNYLYLGGNNPATMGIYPVFPLRGGAPTLNANLLMSFIYVSDTIMQFRMRGADGVTRIHNMTFA